MPLRSRELSLDIQDLSRADLEAWCESAGEARWRAAQILAWVHRKDAASFDAMSSLSRALRAKLAADFRLDRLAPAFVATAADGTRKLLFHLPAEDGGRAASIESVLIPQFERADGARDRLTLCISSQAGCGMGCGFCATARMGLVRNLRPGEIVGQVRAGRALAAPRAVTNVVLMGMGEPLANYDATWTAVERLHHDIGLSARHITISTVGVVPGMRRLATEALPVTLAVSLHAADDTLRETLVPLNRRYPIAEVLDAAAEVAGAHGRRVSFEYAAIAGVNDRPQHAEALGRLLNRWQGVGGAHVNVIPLNPTAGFPGRASSPARLRAFADGVRRFGVNTTVRRNRGVDIDAACGQLRTRLTTDPGVAVPIPAGRPARMGS